MDAEPEWLPRYVLLYESPPEARAKVPAFFAAHSAYADEFRARHPGALLMIGPGSIGLVASPYTAIALFCMGGFAHQMISALLNTLSADVFDAHEVATANGFTGTAAWTGGLTFSLIVGALANTVGYGPLFACLALFDIIGAIVVILLVGVRRVRTPN